MLDLIKIKFWN